MSVRVAERRRSVRVPVAYPAELRDQRGRMLARGRAANASEGGVFVIVRGGRRLSAGKEIVVELTIPSASDHGSCTRRVIYLCRIARCEDVGHLVGLGSEFLQKLA